MKTNRISARLKAPILGVWGLVLLFSFCLLLSSCEKKEEPVSGVTLNPTTVSIPSGGTYTLTATVLPDNAANKAVTWSSSNTAVAAVKDGLVTAGSVGTATVTVTTQDGNKPATCAVTVTPVAATGVTLSQTAATVTAGSTLALTATVQLEHATNKAVTWTTGDSTVATVSSTGLVTALAGGSTTITATAQDGGSSGACTLTVTQPVSGIELSRTTAKLSPGGTMTLTATVLPENATNKTVTWSSNNAAVATVKDGTVTAIAEGAATITATTQDGGMTATCVVSVVSYQIAMTTVSTTDLIYIGIAGSGVATVDWGDGTTKDTLLGSSTSYTAITHLYATAAGYTITITGYENITKLFFFGNDLTSLDVSGNTALTHLNCSYSSNEKELTYLNVSGCTALTELNCQGNNLTSLDVSSCTALTELSCGGNQLTSLNVSGCTALTTLECFRNQLTSLDVSSNTALTYLRCWSNQFTAEALNALFGTLHSNAIGGSFGKIIYIRNNPGTGACDQSIATAKGWEVDTNYYY